MAWSGLIRVWNDRREAYQCLVLRIEDTSQPGCLVRLYDGDAVIGEELADAPQEAVARLVQAAQRYLNDNSISEKAVEWVQL